ncbi:Jag N-terminal domain-containing protein [Desulfovibrio sp. OttesenSCG-928-G15]|nr:Jag N-terminal domain-containing protein [Desulfovibrio sp. OttesenSCG-928-G15]
MAQYKEFQGKTLDEAIKDACEYYGVSRSKLEIDIISDAKTGIFGLVGAKKATIRACRANFDDLTAKDCSEDTVENKRPRGTQKQSRTASSRGGASAKNASGLAASGQDASGLDASSQDASGQDAAGRGLSEQGVCACDDSPYVPVEPAGPLPDISAESSVPQAGTPCPEAGSRQSRQSRQQGGGRSGGKGPRESGASFEASSAASSPASRQDRQPADRQAKARQPLDRQVGDERRDVSSADNGGNAGAKRGRGRRESTAQKQPPVQTGAASADFALDDDASALRDDLPDMDLANCDQDQLFATVEEVVLNLVSPIVGTVPCSVALAGKRVRAELDCGEAAGILVGREGQTLASLQYLASRIVSRKLGASVHVQLDTGRYRERQEDRLRELALSLAEKVKKNGRQQATRPLSAYQRRVVHLVLEPDSAVQTKSSGDGPQRRVVIFLNKAARQEKAGAMPETPESHEDDSPL